MGILRVVTVLLICLAPTACGSRLPAMPGPIGSCDDGMIQIPAGTFTRPHKYPVDVDDDEGTIVVDDFCLDRTEVTVRAYGACKACPPPGRASDECNARDPGRLDHPINCVSWRQAKAYCQSVGKRLPSKEEWFWAASGAGAARRFPFGEDTEGIQPCWVGGRSESKASTCPAGSHLTDSTLHGALDMSGNVTEWVTTWSDANEDVIEHIAAGGDYRATEWVSLESSQYSRRTVDELNSAQGIMGFRCATSLAPSDPSRPHLCDGEDFDDCRAQCDKGHEGSCIRMAKIYYHGGQGGVDDLAIAHQIFNKLCDKGLKPACYELADMYDKGKHVPKDGARSFAMLESLCVGGYGPACYTQGFCAYFGTNGRRKNPELGRKYLQMGCAFGDPSACGLIREWMPKDGKGSR